MSRSVHRTGSNDALAFYRPSRIRLRETLSPRACQRRALFPRSLPVLDVSPGDILLILILLRPWIKVILTLPACGNSFALRRGCGGAATVRLVRDFPAPAYGRRLVGFAVGANRSGTIESVYSVTSHPSSAPVHVFIKLLNVVGGEDEETKRRGGACHSDAGSATGCMFGFTRQHCYVRRALPHAADANTDVDDRWPPTSATGRAAWKRGTPAPATAFRRSPSNLFLRGRSVGAHVPPQSGDTLS